MNIVRLPVRVTSQKVIGHVSEEFAMAYQLPEGHESVAFFSTDNDDVAYLAADDATKKARIEVIHARTFYGGEECSWSKYGGGILVLFSGPKVEDVKSGLRYVNDFVDHHGALSCFDGDKRTAFYAQTIARSGKYFQREYGIEEGMSYSYLFGGPVESAWALDKALRASQTKLVSYWAPPSISNSCGAVLCGTESACKAATAAYIDALGTAIANPESF